MAIPYYFVLVRGRWAKVIHEDDFQTVLGMEASGWQIVWDSATSPADGYSYAARFSRALQEDFTDHLFPRPMRDPRVLYRSVSLPELADIAVRGSVSGRENRFNEFDQRRLVFFGDALTSELIFQGEDLDRQALNALSNEPVSLEFRELIEERSAVTQSFSAEYDRLSATGSRLRVYGDQGKTIADMRRGSAFAMNSVANWIIPPSAHLYRLAKRLRGLDEEVNILRKRYREMERGWFQRENEARLTRPFTSVVIETVPLSHGFRYSPDHGQSGMGAEDEFGFHTDSVLVADLARIHCVKDREIVRTVDACDIEEIAEDARRLLEDDLEDALSP